MLVATCSRAFIAEQQRYFGFGLWPRGGALHRFAVVPLVQCAAVL